MHWLKTIVIPVAFAASTSHAAPEGTTKEFIDLSKSGDQYTRLLLRALVDGIEWANTEVTSRTGKSLFCEPDHLALVPDQVLDMLSRFATRHPNYNDARLGLTMLRALEDAFPCPSGKGL